MSVSRQRVSLAIALAAIALAGCSKTGAASLTSAPVKAAAKASAKAAPSVTLERGAEPPVAVSAKSDPLESLEGAAAVPDEVIVKFKQDTRALPGATQLRALPMPGTAVYKLNKGAYSLQQAAEEWEAKGDIDYIEPNYIYSITNTPNDPRFADSWGVGAIAAPRLWNLTTGTGVKVAVIDTGVDANHPDLIGRVLPGADLVNDDNDATDDHGHGTHCAGTIAAIANNGQDVAGVAPNARIIPIKVLNSAGQGNNADIANGVLEAANLGAKIINLSLGGTDNSETLRRAIADVQARGVIVIAAAGNDGVSTPFYPAANDGVIGVGAVDRSNAKASFSNYGDYIDIAAPGVSITSTRKGGGVQAMSGTSMASPHVAGAAALILARYPNLKAGHILRLFQLGGAATSSFSQAVAPRALNVEEAFVNVPSLDLQPPSVVSGLAGTAAAPGEVELRWNPSTDNGGVVTYRVLRNGQEAGKATSAAYTDRGVVGAATYQVIAVDRDGNEASASASISVTPGAASTKIADVQVASRNSSTLKLTWRTTEGMRCYVQWGETDQLGNGTGWETVPTADHEATLTGLKRFKKYHYRIVAATNASQLHYIETRSVRTKLFFLFQAQ